jgi:flagellar FliL protein
LPISNTSEDHKKQGKKGKPKKKNFILIIFILITLLSGSTAGAYYYFNKPAGAAAETQKAGADKTAAVGSMDMPEVVVNLSGNGAGHYLKVKITLEYPQGKKLSEELKKKKPLLADVIITTLRSKTLDEVSPVSSVESVKKSLLNEINKKLDSGEVTNIYFTDYLVQ